MFYCLIAFLQQNSFIHVSVCEHISKTICYGHYTLHLYQKVIATAGSELYNWIVSYRAR